VLVDVGQQFSGRPVQKLLRLGFPDVVEIGFDRIRAASLELSQQFSHGRRQAELCEHPGMKLGHRRAQRRRGLLQRRVYRKSAPR
jgi:hypothetical protein